MLNKYISWIVMVTIVSTILGCGSVSSRKETMLDRNWGRSFESAKYNQILDPDAGKKGNPIVGLDGPASQANTAKYRESFTTQSPSPVYDVNLSNIGNLSSGR